MYVHCLRKRYFKIGFTYHCSQPIRLRKFVRSWQKLSGKMLNIGRKFSGEIRDARPIAHTLDITGYSFSIFFFFLFLFDRRYSPKSGRPCLCLPEAETSRKPAYIIRYSRGSRSVLLEMVSFISWIFAWVTLASHSLLSGNVFLVVLQYKVRLSCKLKSKNMTLGFLNYLIVSSFSPVVYNWLYCILPVNCVFFLKFFLFCDKNNISCFC